MKRLSNRSEVVVIFLLFIIAMAVSYRIFTPTPIQIPSKEITNYLDSLNKKNELLYAKVDSLQKVKTELYKEYTKTKIKYDTIQIAIDTMPDLEGTKLLLSISRQLTIKGVE
jgi:hypothetical protein